MASGVAASPFSSKGSEEPVASGGYEAWLKKHANMGRCLLVTTPFADNIYIYKYLCLPNKDHAKQKPRVVLGC